MGQPIEAVPVHPSLPGCSAWFHRRLGVGVIGRLPSTLADFAVPRDVGHSGRQKWYLSPSHEVVDVASLAEPTVRRGRMIKLGCSDVSPGVFESLLKRV